MMFGKKRKKISDFEPLEILRCNMLLLLKRFVHITALLRLFEIGELLVMLLENGNKFLLPIMNLQISRWY